jgi:hypothetical protein
MTVKMHNALANLSGTELAWFLTWRTGLLSKERREVVRKTAGKDSSA